MHLSLIYTNTNVLHARAGFDVMEQISTLFMFCQLCLSPKADSELLKSLFDLYGAAGETW